MSQEKAVKHTETHFSSVKVLSLDAAWRNSRVPLTGLLTCNSMSGCFAILNIRTQALLTEYAHVKGQKCYLSAFPLPLQLVSYTLAVTVQLKILAMCNEFIYGENDVYFKKHAFN